MDNNQIKDAKPGDLLRDDKVKGLELRVYPNGRKTFFLYYRIGRKIQRRPKLGDFGEITLAEARAMAKGIKNQVDRGFDPQGERAKKNAEPTIGEAYEKCLAEYWGNTRNCGPAHRRNQVNLWKKHIEKPFANLTFSGLTKARVKAWHASMSEIPISANRAKTCLGRIVEYAIESDLIQPMVNPCNLVERFEEVSRSRYASDDEIRSIEAELGKFAKDYPHAVAFVRASFYTGSRLIALEAIRKSDIRILVKDGQKFGVVAFHGKSSKKTGQEETIVIPPQILDELLALGPTTSGTLFGTKYPRWLWRKIQKNTGIKTLWARDSRRTFATLGFSGGVGKDVVGKLLNHHDAATTDIYAKLIMNPRLDAVAKIAERLNDTLKVEEEKVKAEA